MFNAHLDLNKTNGGVENRGRSSSTYSEKGVLFSVVNVRTYVKEVRITDSTAIYYSRRNRISKYTRGASVLTNAIYFGKYGIRKYRLYKYYLSSMNPWATTKSTNIEKEPSAYTCMSRAH